MFGFLKDKLKGALGKLSKEVEKDAVVEKKEVLVEKSEIKGTTSSESKSKKSETIESNKPLKIEQSKKVESSKNNSREIKKEDKEDIIQVEEHKKRGFFQRIFGKKEEEDLVEEKEELIKRAEKVIVEPSHKKDLKKDVRREIKEEIVTEQQEQVVIKEIKKEPSIKAIKAVPTEKNVDIAESILLEHLEVQKKIEQVIPKSQKPHYQVVEEERSKKVAPVATDQEEHKGFFTKITETFTKIQITEEKFEELFWDLEVALLENNVAVEVIDKIKRDLKKELMAGKISRSGVEELIISTLRQSIIELFDVEKIDLINRIREKRKLGLPYIITIIGVNGSGKTTSIAKLTHKFQKEGLTVVLAASDTFRAAAIQQLEEHANRLNVKMVKHDYNSDPAAVAFDAIKYAEAKHVDVVIIDTAGRLHSNTNLMRELEKVIRVCKPDIKIFVGESITGNDCVEQAKEFDKAVGIDAIILAKADVDDKGGAAISVSYILQRPILYIGTGQTYDDLKEFDSKLVLESLEL